MNLNENKNYKIYKCKNYKFELKQKLWISNNNKNNKWLKEKINEKSEKFIILIINYN